MRKNIIVLCSILMCFALIFAINLNEQRIEGTQGVIDKVKNEIPLTNIEELDVHIIGSSVHQDKILIWFLVEGENQVKSYYPFEFEVLGDDEYSFVKSYIPIKRNQEICSLLWKDGYSFMVDFADCEYINIYDETGKLTQIAVESIPFVYYHETVPSRYDYIDYNGNIINT